MRLTHQGSSPYALHLCPYTVHE
uniref:Uncharacterized protein n=1 Tax=Anguilla anguilla TaxID=7936 RepID=A0A0E9RE41_ANGAN